MTDLSITAARKAFFDVFDRVVRKGERFIIARRGKDRVAIIPVEDLEKLQALEDDMDVAAAEAAMAEPGKSIPYDEVRKELGLE